MQKILLVDDSPDIHNLVGKVLTTASHSVVHASTGKEGIEAALRERPSLILLDYLMPDLDGLAVLKRLKNDPDLAAMSTTPVILITGHDSPEFITHAFAAGANDYVRKPINAAELIVRVTSCLRSQALVRDLYRRVMYDELTGLPNRSFLHDRLSDSLSNVQQHVDDQFAVIVLDFDRFKFINESLGHHAGNILLKEAAQRLRNCVMPSEQPLSPGNGQFLARLGGDEFAIMINGVRSRRRIEQLADELLALLAQKYVFNNRVLYLGASLGIVCSNSRYKQADEILRDADTAMYAAKSAGRGCARMFDNSMRQRAESMLQLDCDLRQAIEKQQFLLLFQPILDLQTGRVSSAEALVRWSHPQRGWISPVEFIPAAEESGLIIELGEWILQAACEQFARWKSHAPEHAPPSINVNVARAQLLQPGFASFVKKVLEETGISAHQLTLEVTESGVMTNLAMSVDTLKTLQLLGCQIHLDDFGTGYSSLSCLYQFPIDAIKLDRSLVSNLSEKHYLTSLVSFVLQLAKSMNLRVVAEGIESLEQAQLLRRWGCDYGQGFYFAKPLLPQSIPAFVADAWQTNYADGVSYRSSGSAVPAKQSQPMMPGLSHDISFNPEFNQATAVPPLGP